MEDLTVKGEPTRLSLVTFQDRDGIEVLAAEQDGRFLVYGEETRDSTKIGIAFMDVMKDYRERF